MQTKSGYLGNPNLKQLGETIQFTEHQIIEYTKCSSDPVYFLETYGKIVSLDDGIVPFKLFNYQKKIIEGMQNNKKVLAKLFRQAGKSQTVAGFIAWYCLFNSNKNSVILANKMATAKEIFSRVQFIVENCPKWLQQGVKEWNKTSFMLENGSKVSCAATSPSAVRGQSISLLALDEFGFLRPNLAEEFIASVFPTISSAESSKLVIVSTPNGMNHYYKMWTEAKQGINGFVAIESHWTEHPKRTQKWADEQRSILGDVKYSQEIECIGGESIVTIKDTTGYIQEIPIESLYYSLDEKMNVYYEILTPSGFQSFDSVIRKINKVLTIRTNNRIMRTSFEHQILVNGKLKKSKFVRVGDKLSESENVVSITDSNTYDYLYDPVNVGNGSLYIANGFIHHNCSFIGSSHTLIAGEKLHSLPYLTPTYLLPNSPTLIQYFKPEPNHSYVMTVDTSRGKGLDYSTFHVIDITTLPYQVACTFRDNNISTLVYPEVLYKIGSMYNNAFILIESNDLGQQVADILFYDLEYENVYMSIGTDIKEGGGSKMSPGLRTTKKTKTIGCDMLKSLIENDQLSVNDSETISELTTFTRQGNTYKADDGKHDDLCMSLVLFAYLTTQPVFKELFDYDLRERFFQNQLADLDEQMLPLGYYNNGMDDIQDVVPRYRGVNSWVEGNDDTFNF